MSRRFQIGLLGAGRLGQAFGRHYQAKWSEALPVWSRRFTCTTRTGKPGLAGEAGAISPAGHTYQGLARVDLGVLLNNDIVISAIPNLALEAMAREFVSDFRGFSGLILLTGADAPGDSIRTLIPGATCVRLVPILLPGTTDFVYFVLEPAAKSAEWSHGRAFLEASGSVVAVQGEQTYQELMIMTSPFATVIRAALSAAIGEFIAERGLGLHCQPLAERVTALSVSGQDFQIGDPQKAQQSIVTPGGITEAGLAERELLTRGFRAVLNSMSERADSLGPPVAGIAARSDRLSVRLKEDPAEVSCPGNDSGESSVTEGG